MTPCCRWHFKRCGSGGAAEETEHAAALSAGPATNEPFAVTAGQHQSGEVTNMAKCALWVLRQDKARYARTTVDCFDANAQEHV
jgi:hypothetical protein